jgi:hypothetical protein
LHVGCHQGQRGDLVATGQQIVDGGRHAGQRAGQRVYDHALNLLDLRVDVACGG